MNSFCTFHSEIPGLNLEYFYQRVKVMAVKIRNLETVKEKDVNLINTLI